MRIVPFEPSHLIGVTLHPKQAEAQALADGGLLSGACTALDGDGVIAVGGVMETQDGMAGWMLFTEHYKPKHLLSITRALKAGIAAFKDGQVVFDVDMEDRKSMRWAALLGGCPLRSLPIPNRQITRMIAHGA